MAKHLLRDLENLKQRILALGSLVEEATNKAITALEDRRPELAELVLTADDQIDQRELEIEEDCMKILALHQPVAADLRFIIAAMKVNNDLERMGDLAVNIAERAMYLTTHPPIEHALDFTQMAEQVREMVRDSLDSLVNHDPAQAREVLAKDDIVDESNRNMFSVLQELMHKNPDTIDRAINTLSASRHLERIADLATNIAEDVVFMAEGEVIRHRHEEPKK